MNEPTMATRTRPAQMKPATAAPNDRGSPLWWDYVPDPSPKPSVVLALIEEGLTYYPHRILYYQLLSAFSYLRDGNPHPEVMELKLQEAGFDTAGWYPFQSIPNR